MVPETTEAEVGRSPRRTVPGSSIWPSSSPSLSVRSLAGVHTVACTRGDHALSRLNTSELPSRNGLLPTHADGVLRRSVQHWSRRAASGSSLAPSQAHREPRTTARCRSPFVDPLIGDPRTRSTSCIWVSITVRLAGIVCGPEAGEVSGGSPRERQHFRQWTAKGRHEAGDQGQVPHRGATCQCRCQ